MEQVRKSPPIESIPGVMHTLRHNQYEVDVYKLIHLTKELPEISIRLEDYLNELDDPCWTDTDEKRITPREVVHLYKEQGLLNATDTNPELAKHLQQIDRADYSDPILIFESKIIDGSHRFAKAYADGQTLIKAKNIIEIPEGAILKLHAKE